VTLGLASFRSNRVNVRQPVRNTGIKEIEIMIKKTFLLAATMLALTACGDDATGTGTATGTKTAATKTGGTGTGTGTGTATATGG
jgi:hypothetical protein